MLLKTTFVELRVVAARSQKRAGRPHAVSGRPMLIHTSQAMPMPRCAVALRSRFQNGMECVNQMEKTQSTHLAERHGMGTAWYV
jgi:hypothetical protein